MKNFKYKPLQSSENYESPNETNRDESADESSSFHIHFSVKLLFVIFLLTQVFYVFYESEFYKNVNRNQSTISADYDIIQIVSSLEEINSTTQQHPVSGGIEEQINARKDIIDENNYNNYKIITNSTLNTNNYDEDGEGDDDNEEDYSGIVDTSTTVHGNTSSPINLTLNNITKATATTAATDLLITLNNKTIANTTPTTTTTPSPPSSLLNAISNESTTDFSRSNQELATSSTPTTASSNSNDMGSTSSWKSSSTVTTSTKTPTTIKTTTFPSPPYENVSNNISSSTTSRKSITHALTTSTTTAKQKSTTTKTPTTIKTTKFPSPPYVTVSNDNNNNTTDGKNQPRKFYINTSRCHMPYVDPFTPAIVKMFHPTLTTGCTKDEPIVTVHFDDNNKVYQLRTNYTVAQKLIKKATAKTIVDDLRCCYRQIERSGSGGSADSKFKLLPCTQFHQNFTVPTQINGVIVDCSSKSLKKIIQQDAFTFIQVKGREKNNADTKKTSTSPKNNPPTFGILMMGIDSLSRINFRRTMPKTYKYVEDNGWYELKGYNKVADNTYPNLMPLLTGYANDNAVRLCKPTIPGGLDNCTFIWNSFHDYGFTTAYAEDTASISTFNYAKKGFLKPPTDYYFRPVGLAIEKTMKVVKKDGLNYCLGRRQAGEYIYDFGVDFAKRYRNLTKIGLFWTNSFSHNAYYTAATMDSRMKQYFEEMERDGLFEENVVVFFSDHGCRWGPLLDLPEGFLEERLPMFFISLPKWFKQKYPEFSRNLQVNQRRLTSPFDIHMTLQHLLQLATAGEHTPQKPLDCSTAHSLFQEIPEYRDCVAACVPETWCTCLPYLTKSPSDAMVKNVTKLVLVEMNKWLASKNLSSLCSELSLHKISHAFLRDHDPAMLSSAFASADINTYRIEFSTYPKTNPVTQFSATVDYNVRSEKISINVEDIARHSKYEKTAKCVDDKEAKKYCICKNALT
ncbi:uncharacterized protein [Musca autumnalis]|uniref:uncharacterized protein n=1 Tax=Musca autumnalis TaxID=221902 RepID=UPI003CEBBA09